MRLYYLLVYGRTKKAPNGAFLMCVIGIDFYSVTTVCTADGVAFRVG